VTARCDFRGLPIEVTRRLATDYHAAPDWTPLASVTRLPDLDAAAASLLETDSFTTTASYDAIGRVIITRTTPDGSETGPRTTRPTSL